MTPARSATPPEPLWKGPLTEADAALYLDPTEGATPPADQIAALDLLSRFVKEGRIEHSTNPRCSELMPTDGNCDCGLEEARNLAARLAASGVTVVPAEPDQVEQIAMLREELSLLMAHTAVSRKDLRIDAVVRAQRAVDETRWATDQYHDRIRYAVESEVVVAVESGPREAAKRVLAEVTPARGVGLEAMVALERAVYRAALSPAAGSAPDLFLKGAAAQQDAIDALASAAPPAAEGRCPHGIDYTDSGTMACLYEHGYVRSAPPAAEGLDEPSPERQASIRADFDLIQAGYDKAIREGALDPERLRRAIYAVSVRHNWAETTDTEDRTEEIVRAYAEDGAAEGLDQP